MSLLVGRVTRGLAGTGTTAADIVALGERTLLCLRDSNPGLAPPASTAPSPTSAASGSLAAGGGGGAPQQQPATGGPSPFRLQKRLGYAPSCACVYARAPVASASLPGSSAATGGPAAAVGGRAAAPSSSGTGPSAAAGAVAGEDPSAALAGLLVASHDARLFVYLAETLQWVAALPFAPVAIAVGRFGGVAGLVTLLSTRGDVAAMYLGTDPPTGSITGGETVKDLDYAAMDAEHKRLLGVIKDAQVRRGGRRVHSWCPPRYVAIAILPTIPAPLPLLPSCRPSLGPSPRSA